MKNSMENNIDDEITAEEFSYYLITIRSILEITQKDMAKFLGYNVRTYISYEKGNRLPDNWKNLWKKLQHEVKNHQRQIRGTSRFISTIDKNLSGRIIEMHKRGKNIVYIGTRLDIDETDVYNYLSSQGYKPYTFSPGY